jgi:hypothetical protein
LLAGLGQAGGQYCLPGKLPGFLVGLVLAAVGAVLLQLQAVRVVAPVLPRDVVAVLALLAGQRDLRPYVGGSHDGVPFWARDRNMRAVGDRDLATSRPRAEPREGKVVARAGLEPATQRL